ncbi:hypothetical protein PTKIN_Ptkin09bG0102100 [Pterospermum kingtungense]
MAHLNSSVRQSPQGVLGGWGSNEPLGGSGSQWNPSSSPRPYQPLPKTTQERLSPPPRKRSWASFSKPQIGTVLLKPYVDIATIYDFGKELGRGTFGVTYLCTEKATERKYACKSFQRRKLTTKEQVEDVRRETLILQHLTGHPNIVEFKGAYEDRHNIDLVMELCSGGELFDRIIAKGSYSERHAASICRQIVNAVHYCHLMGVIHRNIKPENIVLVSNDDDSPIKVIDFGLSLFTVEDTMYEGIVGTAYYIAPEMLKGKYGKEIDMWSVEVILYILLSGVPPFWGENDGKILEAVLEGNLDLESLPWPSISDGAKDLIRKMLERDPKKRITAAQALGKDICI